MNRRQYALFHTLRSRAPFIIEALEDILHHVDPETAALIILTASGPEAVTRFAMHRNGQKRRFALLPSGFL